MASPQPYHPFYWQISTTFLCQAKFTVRYNASMSALWVLVRRFWLPIAIGTVIIVGFLTWVQFSKETNCFAEWVFDFLTQWAIVLGAVVTLMLALAAFWNISDTRHFRYVESITRSLHEIRSWALDAKRVLFLPSWDHQWASQYNLRENLEHIATRSVFVKNDAERLVNSLTKNQATAIGFELARRVNDAATHLEQFINNLRQIAVGDFGSLSIPWENLNNDFDAVIESASHIKIPLK